MANLNIYNAFDGYGSTDEEDNGYNSCSGEDEVEEQTYGEFLEVLANLRNTYPRSAQEPTFRDAKIWMEEITEHPASEYNSMRDFAVDFARECEHDGYILGDMLYLPKVNDIVFGNTVFCDHDGLAFYKLNNKDLYLVGSFEEMVPRLYEVPIRVNKWFVR